MLLADVFVWLDNSQLAHLIRQLPWLFPAIEVLHIIGFVVLVGSAFLFDLRLLGVSRKLPVKDVASYVLPWSRRSLMIVLPTGFLLFISQAQALSSNWVFGVKLLLLTVALINASVFHARTFSSAAQWSTAATPARAKAAAILSLILWTSIITCGRWIAYF